MIEPKCESCKHFAVFRKGATYKKVSGCCTMDLECFGYRNIFEMLSTDRCEMYTPRKENEDGRLGT